MDIKYTSDGKKVAVIGKLNAQETIVQEIFVVGEAEIPSGENFVVKSLHDAPAVSWAQKEKANIEASLAKTRREATDIQKRLNIANRELRERLNYVCKTLRHVAPESFDVMVAVLSGEITHYVVDNYGGPRVLTELPFYDGKLRLLSLFGRDDGTLNYYLHTYYDGSGSGGESVYPCRSEAEAEEVAKGLAEKRIASCGLYHAGVFGLAKKYDIPLDAEKVAQYREREEANIRKRLEESQANVATWETKLSELLKEN